MADISLIDPYSAQQESIARQRRMAQALQQQAQAPMEMPQTPGVLISPYAGLAKVLQGAYGGYQEAEADKEYRALAEEARKNQAEDLAKVFGAARAPARPEIAGQEAVMDMPERIIPGQTISQYGGTLNIPGQTIPKVAYQPAIAPQPARPAGYISPELIADIKDPTARNLALAQLIKQAEPETFIKGSPGDVFFDKLGNKKFSIPAAAGTTPPSDLARLLAERAVLAAKNPTDPSLATYDFAIEKLTQDKNLAFQREKFEYETANPGYSYERVKNLDGSETIQAINKASGVARPVRTGTGQVLTSAAQEKTPIYSDVVRDGKIYKMDLNKPESKDNLIFVKDQSPDLMEVKTTKDGKNVTIYVNKSELKGIEYPEQYSGIVRDLLQAQDIMKYQKDPNVIALVGAALNKGAGLPTQEDVANYLLQLQKAKAESSYNNILLGNVGPPLQAAPNVLTGQYPSGSNAPAPAANGTKAAPLPLPAKISDYKAGQYYLTNKGVLLFNGSKFVD